MMLPEANLVFSHDDFSGNDIKVLNFHPIHIALNSQSMKRYRELKGKHDLTKLRLKDIPVFRNGKSDGVESYLKSILSSKDIEFCHFKDRFKL
jgi:hypothetical protein